jgi:hypothetical protein
MPMVDWCHAGDADFTDPFFEQTIASLVQRPFNLLFRHQTPIDDLPEINAALPGLEPAGFIFHWSRCGSTLISRMLAASPQNLVLSEPHLLDFVFRAHPQDTGVSDEQRINWLRALIGALGQKRRNEHARCFVKFDSWHTLHLPLVRRAFPDVPWIFVYRDPIEIMVSHHKEPAAQMIPGLIEPRLLGVSADDIGRMQPDEYCACVLAAILQAALAQAASETVQFVNYSALPDTIFSSILPFFNLNWNLGECESLREIARFNAKEPSLPFTPDSAAKQKDASEGIRQLSEQWLHPLYRQTELGSIT